MTRLAGSASDIPSAGLADPRLARGAASGPVGLLASIHADVDGLAN